MTLSGTQGDHLRVLLQYAFDAVGEVEHLVQRGRCSDLQHAQETLTEYSHLIRAEERWVPQEVLDRHPSYTTFNRLIEEVRARLRECDRKQDRETLSGVDQLPRWMR